MRINILSLFRPGYGPEGAPASFDRCTGGCGGVGGVWAFGDGALAAFCGAYGAQRKGFRLEELVGAGLVFLYSHAHELTNCILLGVGGAVS